MIWVGEREIIMPRGWVVQYTDGSVVCEDDMPWNKVPNKKNIRRMILKWEDRLWSFDDKENYTVPAKKGYIDITLGGMTQGIHSRTIGYYDVAEKCKIIMRVEEATGKMTYEVEPF